MITGQAIFLSSVLIFIGMIFWMMGKRIMAKGKLAEATIIRNIYSPNGSKK
jgi:hypothetical protein